MAAIHPFQRAGLGFAPFRLVEVCRRAGGCCAYCGAVIANLFVVSDVDGKKFSVGCDCIAKVAAEGRCDPQMVRDAKRMQTHAKRTEWVLRLRAARAALDERPVLFTDRPHPFKTAATYRDDVLYRCSGLAPQAVWRKAVVEVERTLRAAA